MTSPLRFDPSGHTTASDPTSQPFYSAVVCDVGLEANVVCNHFFPLNMEAERFWKRNENLIFSFLKGGGSGIFFAIATKMIYLILLMENKERFVIVLAYNFNSHNKEISCLNTINYQKMNS